MPQARSLNLRFSILIKSNMPVSPVILLLHGVLASLTTFDFHITRSWNFGWYQRLSTLEARTNACIGYRLTTSPANIIKEFISVAQILPVNTYGTQSSKQARVSRSMDITSSRMIPCSSSQSDHFLLSQSGNVMMVYSSSMLESMPFRTKPRQTMSPKMRLLPSDRSDDCKEMFYTIEQQLIVVTRRNAYNFTGMTRRRS